MKPDNTTPGVRDSETPDPSEASERLDSLGPGESSERPDSSARTGSSERPINPLAALTLVLIFPGETFRRLKLRPNWIVPILFIAAAVIAKSLLSLGSGVLDEILHGEALRTGVDIETVHMGAPMAFISSGVIGVPVVILLQALFFKAVGKLFGGFTSFKTSLSALAYASVPIAVGALATAALIPLTHSADLGADLSRFVNPVTHPFLWGAAREIGVVPLWFYLLVGISAEPVLGLPRRRARFAAVTFAVVHILIMSMLGSSEARTLCDPLEDWHELETRHAVLRFPEGTGGVIIDAAHAAAMESGERVSALTGVFEERIDCYVYPSLAEKERVTGNGATAHGVTWANAVHVAWEGAADVAMTREMAKVAGARSLGKMYNPFIMDGLAVHAGRLWGGRPVLDVAHELHGEDGLPALRRLIEPTQYAAVERHVGEVAAGSFTSFVLEELGTESYRHMYSYISRTGAPLDGVLERVLGDSLAAIEGRWLAYVTGSGPGTTTDRD